MKVIDLLNKIANGEEVPKEIKYNNINYYWCNQCKIYERIEDGRKDLYNDLDNLNDEVEILEEEKKIPEKLDDFDIQGLEVSGYSMTQAEYLLEDGVKENRKIINWILDYLKSKGK